MELYKKYRPGRLKDVVGCAAALKTLRGMLKKDALPHTILFTGPSGCGKTTLARILQSMLTTTQLDRSEMNSASYRGIESIRELERASRLVPIGTNRVWILDEVHKWTSDAQNASLKLLEDTPKKAYFFLCTTDPQKMIKPLKNRCTQVAVASLTQSELKKVLDSVIEAEGLSFDDENVSLLAEHSEGSARTALVLLDRLRFLPIKEWESHLDGSIMEVPNVVDLCRALLYKKKWSTVSKILQKLEEDPESVRYAILGYATAVLLKSPNERAYEMIQSFCDSFIDSKRAGLVGSCYEVVQT